MAKVTDDGYKPLIDLGASSNAAWTWEVFGSACAAERDGAVDAGGQRHSDDLHRPSKWTATDPFQAVMGINTPEVGARLAENAGRWQVYLPCGLAGYDIDGSSFGSASQVEIEVSANGAVWAVADISDAGDPGAWVAWNQKAGGLAGGSRSPCGAAAAARRWQ